MLKPRTLRVFANPYHHLDENGRPCGLVAWDPEGHTPDRGWVGARIVATEVAPAQTVTLKGRVYQLAPAQHERTVDYDHEPTTLPETPRYLSALRHGTLIAADEATATATGVKFVDPETALAAAKVAAAEAWAIQAHDYHPPGTPRPLEDHLHGKALGAARAKAAADAEKSAKATAAPKSTKSAPADQPKESV